MRWIFTCIIFCSGIAFGQSSPFVKKEFANVQVDSSGNYSFLVSGHFYGAGTNASGLPANTLLANLDEINQSGACMLMCLGDLFKDPSNDIPGYEKSFFSKLKMPLFNAPGNHDTDDPIYEKNYGPTSFLFKVNNDYHLVLDTERNDGDLNEEDLNLLREIRDANVNNCFIYSHRTIWKSTYPELDDLFKGNTQSLTGNNFKSEVLPLLKEISVKMPVYFFSGSMGGGPASFFHYQADDITYVVTSIRELKRDAMLMVNVNQGQVSFETMSLTAEPVEPLTAYGTEYWLEEDHDEPFNWGIFAYEIQKMLLHWYFWLGVIFTGLGSLLIFLILRKRRKNKLNR